MRLPLTPRMIAAAAIAFQFVNSMRVDAGFLYRASINRKYISRGVFSHYFGALGYASRNRDSKSQHLPLANFEERPPNDHFLKLPEPQHWQIVTFQKSLKASVTPGARRGIGNLSARKGSVGTYLPFWEWAPWALQREKFLDTDMRNAYTFVAGHVAI